MGAKRCSGGFSYGAKQKGNCLFRAQGRSVDGDPGHATVEGVAEVEARLSGVRVAEVGSVGVAGGCTGSWVEGLQHAAVEEGGEGGVEKDGEGAGGLLQEEAVGESLGSSATEGEDELRLTEGAGEGGGFETAEVGLAVALEEFRDSGAGAGFEMGVEVEKGPTELVCKEAADGGFAGPHEAGEDDAKDVRGECRSGFEFPIGAGFDREDVHGFSGCWCRALRVC